MLVSAYETSMEPWIDKRCGVTQDLAARGQALEPRERPPSGPKSTPIKGLLSSWAHSE
jgi:hypothetical protein